MGVSVSTKQSKIEFKFRYVVSLWGFFIILHYSQSYGASNRMVWDLEKRSQASSTCTCTSTPSLLSKKPFGGFHIVVAFSRVGWCSKLYPLLILAKHQLHPLHYCFMEVHNQVRSHVCLLPDTSIQGCHEVLCCCHPISRHQSVHKISHVNAWLRDCCRNIMSRPGQLHLEGMYSKACWWPLLSGWLIWRACLHLVPHAVGPQQLQSMSVYLKSATIAGSPLSYRCTSWVCQGSTFLP